MSGVPIERYRRKGIDLDRLRLSSEDKRPRLASMTTNFPLNASGVPTPLPPARACLDALATPYPRDVGTAAYLILLPAKSSSSAFDGAARTLWSCD
jgi:hypothetical protein